VTYEESSALMVDSAFKGKVKVACLKYAESIMIEPSDTVAHNSRLRWARDAFQEPDTIAMRIQQPVVMDPAIQLAGAAASDDIIQGAVEATVNKLI
jgi:hypothetical protein